MDKVAIIKQPMGLGDILFLQKIVKKLHDDGYHVIFPIIENFLWLNKYIKDFTFCSVNDNFYGKKYWGNREIINNEEILFLPMQHADTIYPNLKIMESKYKLLNIDYGDWVEYIDLKRNLNNENKLYYDELKLTDSEKYVLVSNNYGSPPNSVKYNVSVETKYKKIYLEYIKNYSLFDWLMVIENACEIYMIDSAINFLIEILNIVDKPLYLYTRRKNDFSEIDYLFKTKYILKYD